MPETVEVGTNVVCGEKNVSKCIKQMMQVDKVWRNAYGNGDAAKNIIKRIYPKKEIKCFPDDKKRILDD